MKNGICIGIVLLDGTVEERILIFVFVVVVVVVVVVVLKLSESLCYIFPLSVCVCFENLYLGNINNFLTTSLNFINMTPLP